MGRLAEIYTGEGKTLIIAMLAVLLCKKKLINVDIVTSSQVLAIRDAKELASFYELFSVSVAHNINNQLGCINNSGMLECYKAQVIYGDAHSFQVDILKHQYERLGTMGERKGGYVIVDEVDSMLIDGNSNKTQLSTTNPGMLEFLKELGRIWVDIYDVQEQVIIENQEAKLLLYDLIKLDEYLLKCIDERLQNNNSSFQKKFINIMKKEWIKNAIQAKYFLHDKVHYIIDSDVRIIDYQNTGVIHKENTKWEKGLHQFLQLKHNLPLTPLTINSSFLSNVVYFKNYKNNILGLTGTLGSKFTQNLLANSYNVDFVFLPPNKKRVLKEFPGIVTKSKVEWLQVIIQSVLGQIESNRSVLVINQTIEDVQEIEKQLSKYKYSCLTYYDDRQNLTKDIGPKQIIIATNLAGRGTDLTTNEELERNGGLHVIMSFLPRNMRIQCQGFGRTARQGKKGTAQLIINIQTYLGIEQTKKLYENCKIQDNLDLFNTLIQSRDQNEQEQTKQMQLEMDKQIRENQVFNNFFQVAKQINKESDITTYYAIQEQFALYKEQYPNDELTVDLIDRNFRDVITNPHHYILGGITNNQPIMFERSIAIEQNWVNLFHYGNYNIEQEKNDKALPLYEQCEELLQDSILKDFLLLKQYEQINQMNSRDDIRESQEQFINFTNANNQNKHEENEGQSKQEEKEGQNKQEKKEEKKHQHYNFCDQIRAQINIKQKILEDVKEKIAAIKNNSTKKIQLVNTSLFELCTLSNQEEQYKKDIEQFITYGPIPYIPKIKNNWQYVGMFFIGVAELCIGYVIFNYVPNQYSFGWRMCSEGIEDILLSIRAYKNGIDINWDSWQDKTVLALTSLLSGKNKIMKYYDILSTTVIAIDQFLQPKYLLQLPYVSKSFLYTMYQKLFEKDQVKIKQLGEILGRIFEVINKKDEILKQAELIVNTEESQKAITKIEAQEILQLIQTCLEEVKKEDNKDNLQNIYCQLAQKYLKIKMQKCKCKADTDIENKIKTQELITELNTNIQNYQKEMEKFKEISDKLTNHFFDCYNQDQEIQKMILTFVSFLEYNCNPNKVKEFVNEDVFTKIINNNYKINSEVVQEVEKLITLDIQQINRFYQKFFRPHFYTLCEIILKMIKLELKTEPLKIHFIYHYTNYLINNQGKLQQRQKEKNEMYANLKNLSINSTDSKKLEQEKKIYLNLSDQLNIDIELNNQLFQNKEKVIQGIDKVLEQITDFPKILAEFDSYLKSQNIKIEVINTSKQILNESFDNFKQFDSNSKFVSIELKKVTQSIFEKTARLIMQKIGSK